LFTFPENSSDYKGWVQTKNQLGWGAVGLVFDAEALRTLFASKHMSNRVTDVKRGHKSIDGAVVTALGKGGYREYVHNPSLTYHTGVLSAIGNDPQPQAVDFKGQEFDAMELLNA